ncbi:MAG: hypothetical protein M0C28_32030 [Candidatus Moduliflexus flocculans]|nr:hypothetical protein [Candidatus Moduliflexus flocculans]
MAKAKARSNTIRGYITENPFEEESGLSAVYIETEEGEEFYIEKDEVAEELEEFLDEEVEATGSIREDHEGRSIISIKSYRIVDEEEEDERDDEEDEDYSDEYDEEEYDDEE